MREEAQEQQHTRAQGVKLPQLQNEKHVLCMKHNKKNIKNEV